MQNETCTIGEKLNSPAELLINLSLWEYFRNIRVGRGRIFYSRKNFLKRFLPDGQPSGSHAVAMPAATNASPVRPARPIVTLSPPLPQSHATLLLHSSALRNEGARTDGERQGALAAAVAVVSL